MLEKFRLRLTTRTCNIRRQSAHVASNLTISRPPDTAVAQKDWSICKYLTIHKRILLPPVVSIFACYLGVVDPRPKEPSGCAISVVTAFVPRITCLLVEEYVHQLLVEQSGYLRQMQWRKFLRRKLPRSASQMIWLSSAEAQRKPSIHCSKFLLCDVSITRAPLASARSKHPDAFSTLPWAQSSWPCLTQFSGSHGAGCILIIVRCLLTDQSDYGHGHFEAHVAVAPAW